VLEKRLGDAMNLESDVLARYVAQAVQAQLRADGIG
jgi:riboflavin synthase alpha subunit